MKILQRLYPSPLFTAKPRIHIPFKKSKLALMLAVCSSPALSSIDLQFSGLPVVTGNGVAGTSALWRNVASLNGTDLDMVIRVLSNSSVPTQDSLDFVTDGDNARVVLKGPESQSVRVAYEFYVSNTFAPNAGGTSLTIPFQGSFQTFIGKNQQILTVNPSDLAAYTVEQNSQLNIDNSSSQELRFSSSVTASFSSSISGIKFAFQPTKSFELTLLKLNDIADNLANFDFDGNGDFSFDSAVTTRLDTLSPNQPIVNNLVTSNVRPIITGESEALVRLTVVIAGATYQAVSNADGKWSIDTNNVIPQSGSFTPNTDGDNKATVIAFDAANNASTPGTGIISIDTAAPQIEITDSGAGDDKTYNLTEAQSVVVSGEVSGVEDGRLVQVVLSDSAVDPDNIKTLSTTAEIDDEGNWSSAALDIRGFVPGVIKVQAFVSDSVGNEAQAEISNGTVLSNVFVVAVNDVGPTNIVRPPISGTTNAPVGSRVTVRNSDDLIQCLADVRPAQPMNNWQCEVSSALPDGSYTFSATVEDNVGNRVTDDFRVLIDVDSDNDGLPDVIEGLGDSDGDGIPDFQDVDADGDGILDADEVALTGNDSDQDGIDDAFDVDQTGGDDVDGDGIDDDFSPLDTDNDGVPNYLDSDSDGDGLPDSLEGTSDTDNDSVPNYLDLDSDNDTLPDGIESGVAATLRVLGRTFPDDDNDVDKDGIPDLFDVDSYPLDPGVNGDINGDGIVDILAFIDSDADGVFDFIDPDSDNDGIPDTIEAGSAALSGVDADNDAIDDALDADQTNGADANGDGIDDDTGPKDQDGDGVWDVLDLDSDSDGIIDAVEGLSNAALQNQLLGKDTDQDGIDDAYDVDAIAGAVDINLDGVSDSVIAPDFDQDSIPDFQDLDTDADGLLDVDEAGAPIEDTNGDGLVDGGLTTSSPIDSDNDGLPNFRDLDSNNDEVPDSGDSALPKSGPDNDGDGVINVRDGAPEVFGTTADNDADGIFNQDDLDDDNDGIPDAQEAPGNNDVDSDGDGIVDRLDLDSDNDGLPDVIEAYQATKPDADGDGTVDDMLDSDLNGLDDRITVSAVQSDTDGDSIPDYLDLDSDKDSLSDLAESLESRTSLDAIADGLIDSSLDVDQDGWMDIVDGSVVTAQAGIPLGLPDDNNNGIPNYIDAADVITPVPTPVVSTPPNTVVQAPELPSSGQSLRSAVDGGGSLGGGVWAALGLALLARSRRVKTSVKRVINKSFFSMSVLLVASALLATPQESFAQGQCGYGFSAPGEGHWYNSCWYGNVGLGATHIDPEGEVDSWSTDDDSSYGVKLSVGLLFHPHWFAELAYLDAGEAEVSNGLLSDNVEYTIPSLMLGYLLFNHEREFNVYGKVGASFINTSVENDRVFVEEQSDAQGNLGVGALWRFSPRLFARVEYDRYDSDASYAGISIGTFFGANNTARAMPTPLPAPIPTPMATPEPEIVYIEVEKAREACERIRDAMEKIQFDFGTSRLTESAKISLDDVAELLNNTPSYGLEVHAHTDSKGADEFNMELSSLRAEAVVSYLNNKGISSDRLLARFWGESKPIADNGTNEGRAKNRRVEFVLLNNPECY